MRCRRIPIQGIGERGDIIRMEKEHTCECCKKKERSEKERKDMINRLSRIEGQIRGIKGMVEKDCYCPDIITQVAAANAALKSLIKSCWHNISVPASQMASETARTIK